MFLSKHVSLISRLIFGDVLWWIVLIHANCLDRRFATHWKGLFSPTHTSTTCAHTGWERCGPKCSHMSLEETLLSLVQSQDLEQCFGEALETPTISQALHWDTSNACWTTLKWKIAALRTILEIHHTCMTVSSHFYGCIYSTFTDRLLFNSWLNHFFPLLWHGYLISWLQQDFGLSKAWNYLISASKARVFPFKLSTALT